MELELEIVLEVENRDFIRVRVREWSEKVGERRAKN